MEKNSNVENMNKDMDSKEKGNGEKGGRSDRFIIHLNSQGMLMKCNFEKTQGRSRL